ncbi:Nidogen-like protein [Teladorsagia circumcincta]|uniref:Nidogen-like protein n=1 Tax=Teladorsagia circumcincta TaxID=45464 RepID=A0A2G9UIG0_TELCI|nr:Nidogen-like protein [Teladorsagia circumcincta]
MSCHRQLYRSANLSWLPIGCQLREPLCTTEKLTYRYGSKFRVKSVLIITWEGGRPEDSDSEGNLFQLALVIGDTMTFAHFVYSKLNSNDNAVAGFSSINSSYSLPDSATHDAMLLSEKSDIGIPGEWLFRVDEAQGAAGAAASDADYHVQGSNLDPTPSRPTETPIPPM